HQRVGGAVPGGHRTAGPRPVSPRRGKPVSSTATAPMVSFREVSKVFETSSGPVTAVDAVTLDIAAGEVFGVIGYSGAGKSTLVRLINALEPASSGTVVV